MSHKLLWESCTLSTPHCSITRLPGQRLLPGSPLPTFCCCSCSHGKCWSAGLPPWGSGEEREELSGNLGLKDPLPQMCDCPWLPGGEEAVAEKIGNGSSQFFTSCFWVVLLRAVGSTVEFLQHSCSDAELIFLLCIPSHSQKLMEGRASQTPSMETEGPVLLLGPPSQKVPPLSWAYVRAGWISPLLHKSFRSFGNVNIGSFCCCFLFRLGFFFLLSLILALGVWE